MKQRRLTINDIAEIQIGYQHRDKIEMASSGSHQAIQVKDIDREGRFAEYFTSNVPYKLWTGSLYRVSPKAAADRYLVGPGDVIFLARGNRNFAVPMIPAYVQPFPSSWTNIIALYYFYILRVHRKDVLPEYLTWFVNQPSAQQYLDKNAQGSHMKMISVETFGTMEISVPSLRIQQVIVELERLRLQEEKLCHQLLESRKDLILKLSLKAAEQHIGEQA